MILLHLNHHKGRLLIFQSPSHLTLLLGCLAGIPHHITSIASLVPFRSVPITLAFVLFGSVLNFPMLHSILKFSITWESPISLTFQPKHIVSAHSFTLLKFKKKVVREDLGDKVFLNNTGLLVSPSTIGRKEEWEKGGRMISLYMEILMNLRKQRT